MRRIGHFLLTLKALGTGLVHAIDQIWATLKKTIFKYLTNKVVKARLGAASFPSNKSNPMMEKTRKNLLLLLFIVSCAA